MKYSIPYLLITSILFILYLIEIKKVKFCSLSPKGAIWIAYVIMWLFIGFRGHIMSDFISYYPYYNEYPDLFHLSLDNFFNAFEPGFNLYTAIIRTITNNYFAWVAINTLIDLIVLFWFFRKYCNSAILPLIFFIAFNGLLMEFNLFRNMKAFDLFLLSIPYLQNRKWFPYFALNILGISFHTTSVIYLPLYFFLYRKYSNFIIWGGFFVANIIFISNIGIIGSIINNLSFIQDLDAYDKITRYANRGTEFKFSIGYFERTIGFIIFASLYKKIFRENRSNIIFFNCYCIYYTSFLIFYEVSVFVERIPNLFVFSYWVLYPAVINLRLKIRQLIIRGTGLLVILKIITAINYEGASYQNILIETPNYEKRKALIEQAFYDKR